MYLPFPVVMTLLFAVLLPVGWLISEFQPRRWLRILLGTLSLGMCVFLAMAFASLEQLKFNSWYGTASADLMDATIAGIEEGKTKEVVAGLKGLRDDFYPTYQGRADYDKLVERFVEGVKVGE
ncbi:MAG: hypothetical protein KDA68_18325 [Planctomycetaceae bacterium]|nr:hypothetical protein [Planctomycetaceae bacterium]